MRAMILAAGLGTRLRPLTNDRPKALVKVGERTMLEIMLCRLRAFGVQDVIVNAHHHAEMIREYLQDHNNFGMQIEISHEEVLLDTGGGLKKAAHFFLNTATHSQDPFILHNVDVLSTIDLDRMIRFHVEHNALATLAVQDRKTSRHLLFNELAELCGRQSAGVEQAELVRSGQHFHEQAFCGIHIISPGLLTKMKEEGAFSIIATYLRMAAEGEKIVAFPADEYYWRDLGRPESVMQAVRDFDSGEYSGV